EHALPAHGPHRRRGRAVGRARRADRARRVGGHPRRAPALRAALRPRRRRLGADLGDGLSGHPRHGIPPRRRRRVPRGDQPERVRVARRAGRIGSVAVSTERESTERETLLELIKSQAIVHEPVVLSSGRTADYYIDLRRVTLSGVGAPLAGRLMLQLTEDLDYDAVGGPALAAVPLADAMLHAAAAAGRSLDAFIVRGEAKK